MKNKILIIFLISLSINSYGQNLMKERIRSISGKKKAVFLDRSIFNKASGASFATLLGTRHSYKKSQGHERVVFDFDGQLTPKTYSYAAGQEKKIYIDFFNTVLSKNINPLGKSHYVKEIDYFPITKDELSVELTFKKQVTVDIFFLEQAGKKGRLVLDIKE